MYRKNVFLGLLLVLGVGGLLSCQDGKKIKNKSTVEFELRGQFLIQNPHCGGRRPSDSKRKSTIPYKFKEFVVKKGAHNQEDTTIQARFKTDREGYFSVLLPKGNYCILRANKQATFKVFYAKEKKPFDQFYSTKSQDCFKLWWSECDQAVDIEGDKQLDPVVLKSKCFTGEHPCMMYHGPTPP